MDKHYHFGSGEHGCLYDDGPHYSDNYVAGLAFTFDLGRRRTAELRRDGYLELSPRRDGAEYCEIVECSENCKLADFEQLSGAKRLGRKNAPCVKGKKYEQAKDSRQ